MKTEQKKWEKLSIFKRFAETSNLGYGFANLDGDIIYINSCLCRMLGVGEPKNALGKNIAIYFPDDLKPLLLNEILPTVQSKGSWMGELPLISIKGDIIPAIQNISLIHDDSGKPAYIGNVITNITAHKKAEETLKINEEKYRGIFDESVAAIFVFDKKKNFIDSNQAGLDLLGYSKAELLNMSIPDVDEDPIAVLPAHKQLLSGKRIINYEHKLKKKDGTIITILNNSKALTDINGNVIGMQSTLIDISERKKAEEELKNAYQKLKDTQEQLVQAGKMAAMGQLAAGISHELNQPLTGIKGFAQTTLLDLDKKSPLREDLSKIVEQADRMDKIIQHIRLFARKSDFHDKEADINQPIEDALSLLTEQLRLHNIHIKKSLSRKLPKVCGDQNQLEQVFINLISNAKDAIDSLKRRDRREITITTALSNNKKHVKVVFKDTGYGISKKNLNSIFNPFFTTKSPDGGMGLGLSIVYRIIESHRGSIKVDSERGKGTTFNITLPIA